MDYFIGSYPSSDCRNIVRSIGYYLSNVAIFYFLPFQPDSIRSLIF